MYSEKALKAHPFANPARGLPGQSRWMPHQGKREIDRRRRQRERLEAKRKAVTSEWWRDAAHGITSPITIIPERRMGMEIMTSDKPIGKVQDPGNPVGKKVTWTSSGVPKVGEIIAVIPAGKLPSDFGIKIKDGNTPRDHETFVVSGETVDGPAKGKPNTYWPRVSLLTYL